MKATCLLLSLGLAYGLAACAIHHGTIAVQSIGPAPGDIASGPNGYLVVYTGWDIEANFDRHLPYIVMSEDGKFDQPIRNQANVFDQRPSQVELSPGKYEVIAPSGNYGRLNVPVVIEKGRTTVVYLESNIQPKVPGSERTNLVRLPDGTIAGWAASDSH